MVGFNPQQKMWYLVDANAALNDQPLFITQDEAVLARRIRLALHAQPSAQLSMTLSVVADQRKLIEPHLTRWREAPMKQPVDQTPLTIHTAAEKNARESLIHLLDQQADANQLDQTGLAPLHKAVQKGYTNIVEILLSHGADPNQKTRKGSSPLFIAIRTGNADIVKSLLTTGANPNDLFPDGTSALGFAVSIENETLIRELLKHGANPKVVHRNGQTPFGLAESESIKTLLMTPTIGIHHASLFSQTSKTVEDKTPSLMQHNKHTYKP